MYTFPTPLQTFVSLLYRLASRGVSTELSKQLSTSRSTLESRTNVKFSISLCKVMYLPRSPSFRYFHVSFFFELLYYTSNFNVCWIASWFQMKYFWLQSTFYTQFSVKSQNTLIFTVKWTRYFWARSYSGWVLSSYFLKTMLNWFKSRILSLLMQREPIFSYK